MRHNFRDLEIWKGAFLIVEKVYEISSLLPETEKFGLRSQIQRCVISIPSNIAEGSGRTSDNEFIHFLNIAQGSSYELETQLLLIQKLFNIDIESIITLIQENQRMIAGLKRKLTK